MFTGKYIMHAEYFVEAVADSVLNVWEISFEAVDEQYIMSS